MKSRYTERRIGEYVEKPSRSAFMSKQEIDKSVIINSVDRSLDILEYLYNANQDVSVTQISKDLGVYKSTVYRTLVTLQNRGYVRQNPNTERYSLGFNVFVLSSRMNQTSSLIDVISPYLQKLNQQFQEAVNLSIMDLDATNDIVVLAVDDAHLAKLTQSYPYYTQYILPAGTYESMSEAVATVAVKATFVASNDLSEDVVYNFTKALFENKDEIAVAHAKGAEIDTTYAVDGIDVAFHPGAEKYFKEIGAIK